MNSNTRSWSGLSSGCLLSDWLQEVQAGLANQTLLESTAEVNFGNDMRRMEQEVAAVKRDIGVVCGVPTTSISPSDQEADRKHGSCGARQDSPRAEFAHVTMFQD